MTASLRRLGNCFSKLNLHSKTGFPKASISILPYLGRQTSLQPISGDLTPRINGLVGKFQNSSNRSFSTQNRGQNCVLTLLNIDVSGVKQIKISFSAKQAKKISDLVAKYFDLNHYSDRKAIESMIFNPDFDRFTFTKTGNPGVAFGLEISGDTNATLNQVSNTFCQPDEKPGNLLITKKKSPGDPPYNIKVDHKELNNLKDYSLTAFFNSHSLESLDQSSTISGATRHIKKLDMAANNQQAQISNLRDVFCGS